MKKHRYSKQEQDFLKEHFNGCNSYQELTDKFNENFGTSLKMVNVRECCNKRLHMKGMPNTGEFKKGGKPRDLPIGTIRKSQVGTYIKIGNEDAHISGYEPPNWIPYQQYIWEKEYGPINKGEFVMFLDGNAENFNINNLAVIDRRISVRMAQNRFYTENSELTRTGIMCVKLDELVRRGK